MSFQSVLVRPGRTSVAVRFLGVLAFLLGSTALAVQVRAQELPSGGQLAAGQARIATSGDTMQITQGSDRAILNWHSFSIGPGHSVEFIQPDSGSAILNRVTGTTSSEIAGALSANGQVLLINPNGIAIAATGSVTVGGGFAASTLDISDDDFLSGNLSFAGDGASAAVRNAGLITVGRGGYAALIGGTVANDGLIAVPMGSIGLGAGEQATLDFSGDGFLQVALPTAEGAEGDGALVDNGGTLSAEGGMVVMRAATAREAARHAINLTGVAEARSVSGRNGAITLGGGTGGSVTISGRIDAGSNEGTGGSVTVTGQEIALTAADIDASGTTGGGDVRIGGDWQGGGSLMTADTLLVDAETEITVSATAEGDGGTVVLWSDELTRFAGNILARGAGTGAGGEVEVSGKAHLAYTGLTDLRGPGGFGTLLLDPYSYTVVDAADVSEGSTVSDYVTTEALEAALSYGSVVLSATALDGGNISIGGDVTWSATTQLYINASSDIIIDADVTATTGTVQLAYGGDLTMGVGASVTLPGASAALIVNGTSYTLIQDRSDFENIDNDLTGAYALAADIDLSGTTYTSAVVAEDSSNKFTGSFFGMGHDIANLSISESAAGSGHYGLFGYIDGATVRDFSLSSGSIALDSTNTGFFYAGGLAGYVTGATISGISADVDLSLTTTVSGSDTVTTSNSSSSFSNAVYVGGLIGRSTGSTTISDVYAAGDITYTGSASGTFTFSIGNEQDNYGSYYASVDVNAYAGGLVGYATSSTITQAAASGNVTVSGTATISASGSNEGYTYVAGDGIYDPAQTNDAYADADVSVNAGGLVGSYGTISESYASGDVSVTTSTSSSGSITNGTVSDDDYVYAGGLIGRAGNDLTNVYAIGAVSDLSAGGGYAGGLAGYLMADLDTAYAIGTVQSSNGNAGGLIGGGLSSSAITSAYYSTDGTGQSSGGDTDVVGLTSAQMLDSSNMTGFDETVWAAADGTYMPELFGVSGVVGVSQTQEYGDLDSTLTFYGSSWNGTLGWPVSIITRYTDAGTGYSIDLSDMSGTARDGSATRFANAGVEVTQATLTVTVADETTTYGDYTVWGDNTTSGWKNGQDDSLLSGVIYYYSDGVASGSDVGTYDIGATIYNLTFSGDAVGNYTVVYVDGTLTVAPATLTVTADSETLTYGDTVSSPSYTITGWVNDQDDSLLSGVSVSTAASGIADAGSYATTVSGGVLSGDATGNYTISYVDGAITVEQAPLTVTAGDGAITYGYSIPSLDFSVTGWVNGQDDSLLSGVSVSTAASGIADAGSYATTALGGTLAGAATGNYALSYVDGSLTIAQRAITITADDVTKAEGEIADLTYTITTGTLVAGDALSGGLASEGAAAGADAGTYAITQGSLAASANYLFSFTAGTLTVEAASSSGGSGSGGSTSGNNSGRPGTGPGELFMAGRIVHRVAPLSLTTIPVSQPQVVFYSGTEVAGSGDGTGSTDPRLDGAVCFAGSSFAIACGG